VYGIVYSDSYRNQAGRGWVSKAFTYTSSSMLAGVTAGALLGVIGGKVALDLRLIGTSLLAIGAIAIGGLELSNRRLGLPQHNCETPQHWMNAGALRWAARNGWTLGLGVMSRIGFWLWYVIPFGALLSGQVVFGALLYGSYSLARGAAVWVIILGPRRRIGGDAIALWLLGQTSTARMLTAGQLMLVGVAVALAFGV
jgi:hypothetical protein